MNILIQLTAMRIEVKEVLRFETDINVFAKEYTMTIYYKGINNKPLVTQVNYNNFEDLDRSTKVLYNSILNHVINQRSKNES